MLYIFERFFSENTTIWCSVDISHSVKVITFQIYDRILQVSSANITQSSTSLSFVPVLKLLITAVIDVRS